MEDTKQPGTASTLSPVPPKPIRLPDESLKSSLTRISWYYEDNKAAITVDLEKLGETGMRSRWGITSTTWLRIRHRWWPDAYPKYGKKKITQPASAQEKPAAETVKPPVEKAPERPGSGEAIERYRVITRDKSVFTVKLEDGKQLLYLGDMLVVSLPAPEKPPSFPEFNPKWKKEVQLRWLDVYEELAKVK